MGNWGNFTGFFCRSSVCLALSEVLAPADPSVQSPGMLRMDEERHSHIQAAASLTPCN